MSDFMNKFLKSKYPDYEPNRYRYKFGDIVKLENQAVILITESAVTYVNAYILKAGFGLPKKDAYQRVDYKDLPYEFIPYEVEISTTLDWKTGMIVVDPSSNFKLLLIAEQGKGFTALVLDSKGHSYYDETRIYCPHPYKDYIAKRG